MDCGFKGCDRPHYSGGWCAGHYKQLQRNPGAALKPLREAPEEPTSQVGVRMPKSLRAEIQEAADALMIEEAEWIRRACKEKLKREK